MKLTDFLVNIGQPVGYYPKLTKITGGVKETLFLCQLLYWEGRQADPERWIYKTQEEIEEETGLTRKEQETARKNLKDKGFIEEKYAGIPRKLYYRVKLAKINSAWEAYLANNNVQNGHAGMYKTDMQGCPNGASKDVQTVQTITENTTENTHKNNSLCVPSVSTQKQKKQEQKNPEVKIFIDYYHDKFLKKFGEKPVIEDGKDGKIIKRLLNSYGLEKLKTLLDTFFESDDPFIINSGYTIGAFRSQINKLLTLQKKQQFMLPNLPLLQ